MRRSYQHVPCSRMSTAANCSLQLLSGRFVFATQEEENTLTSAHEQSPCSDNPALVKADKRFWAMFRIRHRNYGIKLLTFLKFKKKSYGVINETVFSIPEASTLVKTAVDFCPVFFSLYFCSK